MRKKHKNAIDAVEQLQSDYSNLEYHIVGSGPLEKDLRDRVTEKGLSDTVRFLKDISDDQLITKYYEAQAFVLPSVIVINGDRDGVPVALKEAMAMETPCLTITVSGIPELIEDEKMDCWCRHETADHSQT